MLFAFLRKKYLKLLLQFPARHMALLKGWRKLCLYSAGVKIYTSAFKGITAAHNVRNPTAVFFCTNSRRGTWNNLRTSAAPLILLGLR